MKNRYNYPMCDEKGPASRGDVFYEESFAKIMDKRAKEKKEVSFNFDLEEMQKAIDSPKVKVPHFDSFDEFE